MLLAIMENTSDTGLVITVLVIIVLILLAVYLAQRIR